MSSKISSWKCKARTTITKQFADYLLHLYINTFECALLYFSSYCLCSKDKNPYGILSLWWVEKILIHFNKDKQKEKKSSLSLDVSGYGIFICSFARLDVFIDKKIFPSLKEPKTGFAKYPNFLHISFIHSRTFYGWFPNKQLKMCCWSKYKFWKRWRRWRVDVMVTFRNWPNSLFCHIIVKVIFLYKML